MKKFLKFVLSLILVGAVCFLGYGIYETGKYKEVEYVKYLTQERIYESEFNNSKKNLAIYKLKKPRLEKPVVYNFTIAELEAKNDCYTFEYVDSENENQRITYAPDEVTLYKKVKMKSHVKYSVLKKEIVTSYTFEDLKGKDITDEIIEATKNDYVAFQEEFLDRVEKTNYKIAFNDSKTYLKNLTKYINIKNSVKIEYKMVTTHKKEDNTTKGTY